MLAWTLGAVAASGGVRHGGDAVLRRHGEPPGHLLLLDVIPEDPPGGPPGVQPMQTPLAASG